MSSLVDKNKTLPLASLIIDASTQLREIDKNEYVVLLREFMFKVARHNDIFVLLTGLLTTLKDKTKELDLKDEEDERLTDRLLFFVFLDTHVGINILRQYRGACRDICVFRREIVYLYLLRMETSAADFVASWGLDAIKDALDSVSKYEYASDPSKVRDTVVAMIEADSGENPKSNVVDYGDDDDECEAMVLHDEKIKVPHMSTELESHSGQKRHNEWKPADIMNRIKRVSFERSNPSRDAVVKHVAAHKYCDKVLAALLIIKENLTNYNNVYDSNTEYKRECAQQMEWFASHFCLLLSMRTEIVFSISHLYDSVLSKRSDINPGSPLGTFVLLRFFTLTHLKMLRHQISARMMP